MCYSTPFEFEWFCLLDVLVRGVIFLFLRCCISKPFTAVEKLRSILKWKFATIAIACCGWNQFWILPAKNGPRHTIQHWDVCWKTSRREMVEDKEFSLIICCVAVLLPLVSLLLPSIHFDFRCCRCCCYNCLNCWLCVQSTKPNKSLCKYIVSKE